MSEDTQASQLSQLQSQLAAMQEQLAAGKVPEPIQVTLEKPFPYVAVSALAPVPGLTLELNAEGLAQLASLVQLAQEKKQTVIYTTERLVRDGKEFQLNLTLIK